MNRDEIDWIENRIAELLEEFVATSESKYAVEIRGLLKIMEDDIKNERSHGAT